MRCYDEKALIIDVEAIDTDEYTNLRNLISFLKPVGQNTNYTMILPYIRFVLFNENIKCYRFNGEFYTKNEDVLAFENFINTFDINNYYSREETNKLLEIPDSFLNRPSQKAHVLLPYKYGKVFYYKKEDVQFYLDLRKESKTYPEIKEMLNWEKDINIQKATVSWEKKKSAGVEIIKPGNHPFGNIILIKGYEALVEHIKIIQKIKETVAIIDPYDRFCFKIKNINISKCKALKTLHLFKEDFVVKRYNKIKDHSNAINSHARLFEHFINTLEKELNLYNQEEYRAVCSKYFNSGIACVRDNTELVLFTRFIKSKHRNCKLPDVFYEDNHNKDRRLEMKKDEITSNISPDNNDDGYTMEQWSALCGLVFNSTDNMNKLKKISATKGSKGMAMCWCYIALHFVTSWRRNDIFELPYPELNKIGFNDGHDFLNFIRNGGYFTETMGESICYDVTIKLKATGKKAGKNDEPLKFVVSESATRAIGLLLAICEAHRQITNGKQLMMRGCQSFQNAYRLFGNEYKAIMGNKDFNNIKASNISLKVTEQGGTKINPVFGIYLSAVSRPHAGVLGDPSGTTADIYLTHAYSNKDNDVNIITKSSIDRGFMAHAPYKFLSALDANFEEKDMEKQTQQIQKLALTPLQIHEMSKAFMERQSTIDYFINSLISCGRDKIKQTLINMLQGNAPSKHIYANCLLRASLYNEGDMYFSNANHACVMRNASTCFGCPFLVGEKYFLIEVSRKIKETIDLFNDSVHYMDRQRYSALLQVFKSIVEEAVEILGKEKVRVYITKDLRDSMRFVEQESKTLNVIGVDN